MGPYLSPPKGGEGFHTGPLSRGRLLVLGARAGFCCFRCFLQRFISQPHLVLGINPRHPMVRRFEQQRDFVAVLRCSMRKTASTTRGSTDTSISAIQKDVIISQLAIFVNR